MEPTPTVSVKAVALVVVLLVGLVMIANADYFPAPGNSGVDNSSVAPAATVAAEGDCNGTNGNSAVAACHPDDPAVQAACPDNDYDGDGFEAPEDACLDSIS